MATVIGRSEHHVLEHLKDHEIGTISYLSDPSSSKEVVSVINDLSHQMQFIAEVALYGLLRIAIVGLLVTQLSPISRVSSRVAVQQDNNWSCVGRKCNIFDFRSPTMGLC